MARRALTKATLTRAREKFLLTLAATGQIAKAAKAAVLCIDGPNVKAAAVVLNNDVQSLVGDLDAQPDFGGSGVLDDIIDRLLDSEK